MPRKSKTAAAPTTIVAYKGFNTDLTCRGFAFEIGKSYQHDGPVRACESGFHACEHPLNVFEYYPPATSRYALVELGGETAKQQRGDTKIAAAQITIKAELQIPDIVAAAVRYVFDRAKWISGPMAEKDGEGVRSSRDQGAATASGDWGAATASGTQGAATASGYQGAATASGFEGKARAAAANAIFLVERDGNDGRILNVFAGVAGRDGLKPMAFYRLVDGKPIEVE